MHVINWQWRYLSINLPPVDGQLSNDNNGDARAGDPGAGITRTDYLLNLSASPYSVALPCACVGVAPWSEHLFSRTTFRARVNLCVYGVHLVSCLVPVTRYLRYTFLVESRYSFIHSYTQIVFSKKISFIFCICLRYLFKIHSLKVLLL